MLKFSAGFSFIATHHAALAAEIKKAKKVYTNLEEAREAGEKLREERDTAEGPIIILPSGVKFRELEPGTGRRVSLGYIVSVQYIIYKMNGLYLDSLGYGKEGKDDVGETLTFQFGKNLVPKAVELGMEGMQLGGRRRILVRPQLGWVNGDILPHPTSSAAQRRMLNNLKQPLLFEVELVKILPA
ncbi:hypothetical protein O6H91_20G053600 [Diphasiastrum complanatum]|uniref:Uncharacterized protein n=2 Tax=Diphasiastrum complanatum TaxID=34168 RepID=A0ACC2AQ84_DIPCM|nr:hypothetical protein O6H91_20G053600 [Diphasiastrum complanatum]KAJ7519730.1 hypothetical protein O6H91_20G053600 [Diphasiastrum complanatum]